MPPHFPARKDPCAKSEYPVIVHHLDAGEGHRSPLSALAESPQVTNN